MSHITQIPTAGFRIKKGREYFLIYPKRGSDEGRAVLPTLAMPWNQGDVKILCKY
jgi:hypothetical protein